MQFVTQLDNRQLTYAGVNIVNPELFNRPHQLVLDLLKVGGKVRTKTITQTIDQYNQFAAVPVDVPQSADFQLPNVEFVLPAAYKRLNVEDYTDKLLIDDIATLSPVKQQTYVLRYDEEMDWFKSHDKLDMIRSLIYIVDTLESNNIPWGVGRGSSISSYVLYLIGVHDIHPIEYDLDWREFLRDGTE